LVDRKIDVIAAANVAATRAAAKARRGNHKATFYDWYGRYQEGGIEALVDGKSRPRRTPNPMRRI
jgi:transposase